MKHKYENIFIDELSTHWKYTAGAVIISAGIILLFKIIYFPHSTLVNESIFEGFFISHLFFAALTPSSILAKYKRSFIEAILTAILASSITCTLSDIVLPYIAGIILGYEMHFHICIIEEPVTAWLFLITGGVIGYLLSKKITFLSRYTHGLHILLSTTAAGLYLVTYGVDIISVKSLLFIPIIIFSVLIPCIFNDIGVPSLIVSKSARSTEEKQKLLDEIHKDHHYHHH